MNIVARDGPTGYLMATLGTLKQGTAKGQHRVFPSTRNDGHSFGQYRPAACPYGRIAGLRTSRRVMGHIWHTRLRGLSMEKVIPGQGIKFSEDS
jgi:hypothetical protein